MRLAALLLVCGATLGAQSFTQRGFFETRTFAYPQATPEDSGRLVNESLLRWEPTWKPRAWLQVNLGFDARFDSHRQFERALRLDWADRGLQRPAFSGRRLSVLVNKGGLTVEAGRQFIRWGKADLLNPTDRFAPKDFLNVINSDFLGVTAARLTYERGPNTVDFVYQPVFTPSRGPLYGQRWVPLPENVRGIPIQDGGADFPGRGALGLRYSRAARLLEYSLSFYDGHNHLPLIDFRPGLQVQVRRYFAQMRMYGGDFALPLPWFTVKGEGAYFTSKTTTADEYALYVVQLERQTGEWNFVGGYAGEAVTNRRVLYDFAPDRGLAKTVLGRASYNLDANRTISVEGALRQNAAGFYSKFEYTQAVGAHLRATANFTLLRGDPSDFLGQYRRNSNFQLILRYSF